MGTNLHTTIFIILNFFVFTIQAQDITQRTKCHSHENLMHQIAEHPEMAQQMEATERQIAQFTSNNSVQLRGGQITIPVVVHVVYRTDVENITVAQIQSQLDALNRDFSKQNTDITKVPTEFAGYVANMDIKFQLAARDPQANATTGIVRYQTTKVKWTSNDDIKKPARGGFSNWDPTKYLNLYVCNIGDGILGYASFPNSPVALDGVVIDYLAFGTTGTARSPFNKGRTATHEIGHWMNLIHIWGDSDCGNDNVSDTPQQKDAHYGNVTTPQYSTCTGSSVRDMYMNFMDYVNDDCMFMFTGGQKGRVQATFAGPRASILNSNGCFAPPVSCIVGKPTINNIKTNSANIILSEVLGMKKYTIEYKMQGTTNWTVSQTSNLSLSVNNLDAGATYTCRAKGECADSPYSDEVTFKTATITRTSALESTKFAIYPNPVVHDVNIMFDVLKDGLVNVQIFDSNGVLKTQVAKNITKNTPAVSLDLTEYPSGFYLVVTEKDGQRAVKKLLKVD